MRRTPTRLSVSRLTDDQIEYLAYGPDGFLDVSSAYRSEDEARAAWRRNRRHILRYSELWPGERPWAWWRFDRNLEKPVHLGDSFSYLKENELLREGEELGYYQLINAGRAEASAATQGEKRTGTGSD